MIRLLLYLVAKVTVLALLLVLTFTASTPPSPFLDRLPISQTATQGQKVATDDGEFSILMPAQPRVYLDSRLSFDGGVQLSNGRIYGLCMTGIAFIVESYDASNPKNDLNALLDNRRYIQTFERDISLNGFNGKQYRGYWIDIYSSIQYFATEKKIYVVQVIARDKKNPAISQFLSSLRLGHMNATTVGRIWSDNSPALLPTGSINDQVLPISEVTRKAIVVLKRSPSYSPEGRRKNKKGNVLLQAVFSSTGQVTDIRVLKGLGHGLDEKAVEVAKEILFIPAEKNGQLVSQSIKLEYNFDTGQ